MQRALNRIFGSKITQLRAEVKDHQTNALVKEEEIKTLRVELLDWVNRWRELKLRKEKYIAARKSVIITNAQLLKQAERQRLKILELKAKLSEARRAIKLQIAT